MVRLSFVEFPGNKVFCCRRNVLCSDILYDYVGATFDLLYCSIWPNTALFGQFLCDLDMRPHRRWVFIVVSQILCKDWCNDCQQITP